MSFVSILLGGAVIGVGYWQWRRSRDRQRRHFIATYRFPERLRLKLTETYPQLDPQQQEKVLQGLREYFQLCQMAKRRVLAMPSQAVDVAWHEFILYTRQYGEFCRKGLGRFLHHTPSDVMPSAKVASEGIRRAWRLACIREGIRPDAPTRLPLLFALDAELGIADGFHYRLDCGAHPGSYRNGDAYCASHMGCGSGCASGCGGDASSSSDSSCGSGCGGGGD
ncbi:glycine-rich domain-containing protein [Pseudomonas sp. BMS12]|uniref:glycine-rich domain-containing protein n=1 Tax=Pseudomonas sp. BMS12 TaxID=1796033 RepID=UPI00083B589B|nr:hypothetical protein [Pseudomonas sp. BMS12]